MFITKIKVNSFLVISQRLGSQDAKPQGRIASLACSLRWVDAGLNTRDCDHVTLHGRMGVRQGNGSWSILLALVGASLDVEGSSGLSHKRKSKSKLSHHIQSTSLCSLLSCTKTSIITKPAHAPGDAIRHFNNSIESKKQKQNKTPYTVSLGPETSWLVNHKKYVRFRAYSTLHRTGKIS